MQNEMKSLNSYFTKDAHQKSEGGGHWGPIKKKSSPSPWKRRKTTSATFCATGVWGLNKTLVRHVFTIRREAFIYNFERFITELRNEIVYSLRSFKRFHDFFMIISQCKRLKIDFLRLFHRFLSRLQKLETDLTGSSTALTGSFFGVSIVIDLFNCGSIFDEKSKNKSFFLIGYFLFVYW